MAHGTDHLGIILVLLDQNTKIGERRGDRGRGYACRHQCPQPVDQFGRAGLFRQILHPADVKKGNVRI